MGKEDKPFAKFNSLLRENYLDGFIVTNPVNIFYLCGFRGVSPSERESILIFSPKPTIITARLYQNEARKLASKKLSVKIVDERNQLFQIASLLIKKTSPTKTQATVGFEEENLKYGEFKEFKKALISTKLIPVKNLIEDSRTIKTDEEIKKIERAQKISQVAFEKLIKTVKIGQTEAEIAERLAKIIKSLGGQGLAFESIIASGQNAALPHYVTAKKKIKRGEVLLFDFGAKYKDYCADLSRTVFVGRGHDRYKNIYHHVLRAQMKALEKISHQIKASDVFHAANNHFRRYRLDRHFLHGLGHGIGLEVHKKPYLRPTIDDELSEGMVFSLEPGLYFPTWGGIRIEDLVVIKNGKAKVLGKIQTGIIEI